MSIAGKKSIHYTKKDLASQKTPALGFKSLRFAHKATAGDTVINLSSLTLPTEDHYASFANPSLSELNSAQLLFNRSNLILFSSASGLLNSGSYKVTGNLSIQLNEPALDGEIFEGIVAVAPRTGVHMVDALPICKTGTLAANTDEFVVGNPFRANKFPSEQQGEVMVFLDGQLMKRNVGNATASPSADGNYEEVDNGSGIANTIKFNNTHPAPREVTVVSAGLAFAAPSDSLMAVIEGLAGQVDAMIPVLADAAGVDETDFQAAPNSVDLKTFGNRVIGLEEPGSPGTPRVATLAAAGASKKNKAQTKFLGANIVGSVADAAFITFNNLTIGKVYRMSCTVSATLGVSDTTMSVSVRTGTTVLASANFQASPPSGVDGAILSINHIFIATATTADLYHESVGSTCTILGGGTLRTHAMLEELDNYEVTTDFT